MFDRRTCLKANKAAFRRVCGCASPVWCLETREARACVVGGGSTDVLHQRITQMDEVLFRTRVSRFACARLLAKLVRWLPFPNAESVTCGLSLFLLLVHFSPNLTLHLLGQSSTQLTAHHDTPTLHLPPTHLLHLPLPLLSPPHTAKNPPNPQPRHSPLLVRLQGSLVRDLLVLVRPAIRRRGCQRRLAALEKTLPWRRVGCGSWGGELAELVHGGGKEWKRDEDLWRGAEPRAS